MKITAIKQQIKNPKRASLFVDSKYCFSLSLDELVKYKLKNNDELTPMDIKKFRKISSDGKLRSRSLEWLLNRPHSEKEFRDYLYRKKAEPEQVENLVRDFSEKGYLDNAKFAEWFIELQSRRGKSNRAIQFELLKKGIRSDMAGSLIEASASDEKERLVGVISKKAKLARYRTDPEKLKSYLARQGFDYDLIKESLEL